MQKTYVNKNENNLKTLVLSAMFLALGLVLPFITGNVPKIGSMLLPMHIPVMLCGLICSWKYGLVVGAVTPLLRSVLFQAPPFYPTAVAMAFELAVYGGLTGLLYQNSKWECTVSLYKSMLTSMLAGRLVWGAAMLMLTDTGAFGFSAFMSGAFINAFPGIILQLSFIPAVMVALSKAKLVSFKKALGKKENKNEPI